MFVKLPYCCFYHWYVGLKVIVGIEIVLTCQVSAWQQNGSAGREMVKGNKEKTKLVTNFTPVSTSNDSVCIKSCKFSITHTDQVNNATPAITLYLLCL